MLHKTIIRQVALACFLICGVATDLIAANSFPAPMNPPPDPKFYNTGGYVPFAFTGDIDGENRFVNGFFPTNNNGNAMFGRPLVIVLHGNGYDSFCSNCYIDMMKHLAANGFFVVRPDWDSGKYATAVTSDSRYRSAERALRDVVEEVYARYPQYLSNQVALIGHSVGGAGAVRYTEFVDGYRIAGHRLQVRAVVALGPSPKTRDITQPKSLHLDTDALLVMMTTDDNDVRGNDSRENGIMKTGFAIYDRAGTETYYLRNQAEDYPERDAMLFHHSLGGGSHGQLAKHPIYKGFTMAYLRRHVYGETAWDYYFKYQGNPASMSSSISIERQHADAYKKVVANFQRLSGGRFYGGIPGPSGSLGSILTETYQDRGWISHLVRQSWQNDIYSPHRSAILHASWDRQGHRGSSRLRFVYDSWAQPDIRAFKYLSFRVAQRSRGFTQDPFNPNGVDLDFKVRLFSASGSYSKLIRLSDYGQKVRYPILNQVQFVEPNGSHLVDVTKNAMQSVLLPLSAFKRSDGRSIDMSAISEIKFYFYGKGAITFDNLEFYE